MKNPITASSAYTSPASGEPVTQNTGRLNGRSIKALLYSALDQCGLTAFIIWNITAVMLTTLHKLKCSDQCPKEFFSFSAGGLIPDFCTVLRISCLFMILQVVIISLVRRQEYNDLLKEIRDDLSSPLTEETKNVISSKIKRLNFVNLMRLGLPIVDNRSCMIISLDSAQGVVFTPDDGISFYPEVKSNSTSTWPAPIALSTQNAGSPTQRAIKVFLKSAFNAYGTEVATCLVFTSIMAGILAFNTCPRHYQNSNEMCPVSAFMPLSHLNMCPIPSKTTVTCLAYSFYSVISYMVAIAIACIPGITRDLPD